MGIRTTVAASLGDDSARVSLLYPLLYREDKTIQTRCIFNSLEFGGIKCTKTVAEWLFQPYQRPFSCIFGTSSLQLFLLLLLTIALGL